MRKHAFRTVLASATALVLAAPVAASGQSAPSETEPPPDTDFQKVTLNDRPGEPMDLAVLPNNDVFHVTRHGAVRLNEAETGVYRKIAELDVDRHDE